MDTQRQGEKGLNKTEEISWIRSESFLVKFPKNLKKRTQIQIIYERYG